MATIEDIIPQRLDKRKFPRGLAESPTCALETCGKPVLKEQGRVSASWRPRSPVLGARTQLLATFHSSCWESLMRGGVAGIGDECEVMDLLHLIELVVGDDSCEEWDMLATDGQLDGASLAMNRKLGEIYKAVHSLNPRHECHHVHGDWRIEATANLLMAR